MIEEMDENQMIWKAIEGLLDNIKLVMYRVDLLEKEVKVLKGKK